MTRQVLLLDDFYQVTQQTLELANTCHRIWLAPDREAFLASLADTIEVVATQSGKGIDRATLDALPKLKLVCNFGVGIETIDVADCTRRGITVCNTPDVLTEEVADMALALLLAALRKIPQGDRFVRTGQWLKGGMPLTGSLQQRKVGVVGLGRIGRAIADRCQAFKTDVAYFGPRKKSAVPYTYFDDINAMAQWSDVLIAACPGGAATAGIVSRETLKALGKDGVFVNISRGSVVDQQALTELLVSGEVGTAGLDVFADEPRVPKALIDLDHIVLQPHMGSASILTRTAMGQLVVDNIAAWFDNQPLLTPVN